MNKAKLNIIHQGVIASDAASYIGHPFEGGLWRLNGGSELLVAALRTPCDYKTRHSVDAAAVRRGRAEWVTWRSCDGGRSWQEEGAVARVAAALAQIEEGSGGLRPPAVATTDGDALLAALTLPGEGPGVPALFVSRDKGRTWQGPEIVKGLSLKHPGGFAQSSYCLRSDGALLLFLTTLYPDNRARPCVMLLEDMVGYRILLSYLPQHQEMERVFPSPAALADGRVVVAVTEKMRDSPGHTLIFGSEDGCRTWDYLSRANDIGTPAHLLALRDGRLLLTYGLPLPPYRLVTRLSDDGGKSWSDELTLREGGGSADLGSARSAELPDGAIVTVYQWNDAADQVTFRGGRRYLASLVWRCEGEGC